MKISKKIKKTVIMGTFLFLGGCEHGQEILPQPQKPLRQPLDDQENVEVYTFIVDYLKQPDRKKYSSQEVQTWYEQQKKIMNDPSLKPHVACMQEGEISGLLRLLLSKDPRYEHIALYGKDGVGLATTGMKHRHRHFEERPNELNLGFLTPSILLGPKTYTYFQDERTYQEYILSIYETPDGIYLVRPHKKTKEDVLLGYVSYIVIVEDNNHQTKIGFGN